MEYYRDVDILSSADHPLHFLMSKVFTQIHLALVNLKEKEGVSLGITFPKYKDGTLGSKIRIFMRNQVERELLLKFLDLSRFKDYVHITDVEPVPYNKVKEYVKYSRYQPDSSIEQKARRFSKRHDVSYEEALKVLKKTPSQEHLPYIKLKSLTNCHGFSLFIKENYSVELIDKGFSPYGLSSESTLPKF